MGVALHTEVVPTKVGALAVRVEGSGPVAVLWHSLFLDSSSWDGAAAFLRDHRTLVLVDGPGHGASTGAPAEFSLADCVDAAVEVLDQLGVDGPVDWVGNAWGGHVGLAFAATNPDRCRSLVAVCTTIDPLTLRDRLWVTPLVLTFRLLGPTQLLTRLVAESLLSKAVARAHPDVAGAVGRMFRGPTRSGLYRAARSALLRRPPIGAMLSFITAPTLLVCADGDDFLRPDQVRAAAAQMPNAVAFTMPGGQVSPLLVEPEVLAEQVAEFWRDPAAHVRDCR